MTFTAHGTRDMSQSSEDRKAKLFRRFVEQASAWTDMLMLSRMRHHGYWPKNIDPPPDPPDEASQRRAIERELRELRGGTADANRLLADERKRRLKSSRARRKAKKERQAIEAAERRAAWDAKRNAGVPYLGDGVSDGLNDETSDADKLRDAELPVMHTAADVATFLGVPLSQLRWLTYHRRGAAIVHYHRYDLPKPGGGARCISAPKPQLKRAQAEVRKHILAKLPVHDAAHGFVAGRDIFTNAASHAGRPVVVNLDLADFFGTITFPRVRGVFKALGYSGAAATVLALLTTEPPRVKASLADGRMTLVALGERRLPQGAPTSPAITNRLCRRLDRRLAGHAAALGFTYTRYADDLTFSHADCSANVGKLLGGVRRILKGEDLHEQPKKTQVMRSHHRQEVTGLTVNESPGQSRPDRRELRAILHNAAKHGLASQNRTARPDFAEHLKGRVAQACRCDPARAVQWQAALAAALDSD
ncbi:MAG: reverse transcriptase family protein [Planctomycetota bacterium]